MAAKDKASKQAEKDKPEKAQVRGKPVKTNAKENPVKPATQESAETQPTVDSPITKVETLLQTLAEIAKAQLQVAQAQEKAAAHPGCRNPEDGELEVPGARQVIGQPAGDVEPVKGSCLHPIVGEHASQE